ncbi:uncharacterized protein LOC106659940 [Trichogramma pretiosum]|uniref:uncharacterized protein LOC106659940 n=1 Tax=Trichogramma pretiosum TaxID=7493 RepID=UPI0006C9843D|nr:uncharacterized protein LOC106659940 [Trichogramma pretiosum]
MKKPIEAIIDSVIIEPNKIQPIIVHFQNGQLKDEETNKMKCQLYNDEDKQKVVLAMTNGQVAYKGHRPDFKKELTYTMLAIHNKKTGKVRLVQAEHWDVAPVLDQLTNNNDDQNVDKNAELNKKFGSKKVKRRTEQHEKMKVNVEDIKEQLEKTVQDIQIDKEDLENNAKDDLIDGQILPPCNTDAKHESEIYNIYDIVPKKILKTLYIASVDISESDIVDKPTFFMKTVEYVKTDPKSAFKIAMLLYIEAIANWLNKPVKSAKSKDFNVCEHSADVNSYVLQNYSINNGRLKPLTMRHKGLIHCIILGLIIWDYKLDIEQFNTMFTLRLGTKKLIELARCIRAVPVKDDKKSVVLKIPVPEPVSKVISRKKK